MRARTAPPRSTTVIAAKTNWKKTIVDMGNLAVTFADGITAYSIKLEVLMVQKSILVGKLRLDMEQAREYLLTCFNSEFDDKIGRGIPTKPGIICAPNDIW
jgi:hypothetical protein